MSRPFLSLIGPGGGLLAGEAGYRPVGAVVGVSVVALGTANNVGQSGLDGAELRAVTDTVRLAVDNALRRAREQAQGMGAAGVVSLELKIERRDFDTVAYEVRAIGTAVAEANQRETPFLSNLTGADLVALRAAGYAPAGLAVGLGFFRQLPGYRSDNARRAANGNGTLGLNPKPFEHPDYTQATYRAREIAMDRLQADALAVGAEGVVGVQMTTDIEKGEALRISLHAIGTGIKRVSWSLPEPEKPAIVISVGNPAETALLSTGKPSKRRKR